MATISVMQGKVEAVSPVDYLNQVTAAAGVLQGVTVLPATRDSITISRKITPWWVIVLSIVLFPIGLITIFMRPTETLTVVASERDGDVYATINGAGADPLVEWLRSSTVGQSDRVAPVTAG